MTSSPATTKVLDQPLYSSERFMSTYPVATASTPPGVKWAAHKFNSGIHPSAANERFEAARTANLDYRPFQGMPYDPTNTFATTGKIGTNKLSGATLYPSPEQILAPRQPITASTPLSLARLLASR